jgi:hypothetical protein
MTPRTRIHATRPSVVTILGKINFSAVKMREEKKIILVARMRSEILLQRCVCTAAELSRNSRYCVPPLSIPTHRHYLHGAGANPGAVNVS